MTDKMTCVSGCGKELVDDQYIPIVGYGNMCGDCAFNLALMLIDQLRRLSNKDIAVVEFGRRHGAHGMESFFNVYDATRAIEIARGDEFSRLDDSKWNHARLCEKILDGIRLVLCPHQLKQAEAEIADTRRKLEELEKRREMIMSANQFTKA